MENKTKIVVTGGAGFVGAHLSEALVAAGYEVHIIDNLVSGKRGHMPPEAIFHDMDIRNLPDIKGVINGAYAIFHLAALPSVPYSIENPAETTEVNLLGTVNVLTAARDAGADRVVFSSSAAVYGDAETSPVREELPAKPKSPYGLQKFESELNCGLFSQMYGLKTVSLRYFNIYGPRQNPDVPYASVIPKFIQKRKNGEQLPVFGSGEQTRDFVHVKDVAEANMKALLSDKVGKGEAINIGTGRSHSVKTIAGLIGGPMEHLQKREEIMHSVSDITLASKLLDWKPKWALEDGIKELL
jgi:UDP-glucose 4-epimerase